MKLIATHKQPVEAKYTKRLMVSGPEGKIQSKILKNVKVYFETQNFIWGDFRPQKWIPGKILILLDPHNLPVR